MAQGYEYRQGGQSFADQSSTPAIQVNSGASANSRGAQVVGGESIGGVEGGSYTQPGYVAAGLGAFFEKFMEPAVQRKQQAQFFKGYTEAQSGRALDELTNNDSPLTKIFGPSGFEQGAQYYTGRTRVDEWGRQTLADVDKLKLMPPEELSKYIADSAQGLLTGDEYADAHIQTGFLEAQGPIIQTIAKARFAHGQTLATQALSEASNSGAGLLQQVATTNFLLGEQGDNEAVTIQATRFLQSMAKPEGLTDENYQKFLYNFMRRNLGDGNFHAVELLRARGIDTVLNEDQQRQISDAWERYGNKALDEAASTPEIAERLLRLDARVAQVEIGGEDPANVKDVMDEYAAINALLRKQTGVDKDFFDADDIRSMGGKVIGARVARYKRDEAARNRIEDREYARNERETEKAEEAAEKLAMVGTVWATGKVNDGLANGLTKSDFDGIAMREFGAGNYEGMKRAFLSSGFASTLVSNQVQSMTRLGLGDKFTKSAETAYGVWKQMNAANPGMASEYFGEFHYAWSTFDRMQAAGDKDVAYRDAFAKPGGYGVSSVPPERRREFNDTVGTLLKNQSFRLWSPSTWGNENLNSVSQSQVQQAVTDEYARIAEFSPREPQVMLQQALSQALNSGRLERYGPLAWINTRGGNKPMHSLIGLNQNESGKVIGSAVLARLKKQGVTSLDGVRVIRLGDNLMAEHRTADGLPVQTPIELPYLKATADQYVQIKRQGVAANRQATSREQRMTHAQRRIPGETTWQRTLRINREMAGR